MENNLVKLFIGSDIEANYIASLLHDNNVECILRNSLEESVIAGWVSGSQNASTFIYIESDDVEKAKMILDEYLDNE